MPGYDLILLGSAITFFLLLGVFVVANIIDPHFEMREIVVAGVPIAAAGVARAAARKQTRSDGRWYVIVLILAVVLMAMSIFTVAAPLFWPGLIITIIGALQVAKFRRNLRLANPMRKDGGN